MIKILYASAIIILFISTATFARAGDADSLAEARRLFAAGDYLTAADKALAGGSAEGFALATQITCYYSRYLAPEKDRLPLYESAVEMAATALELEPDNAFVRVQNAHALGRYSQEIGILEAIGEGLAKKVREHIDEALIIEPDNSAAHMLLANWHAAIINNAGFIGRMVYGAEKDEVFAHYAEAIRIAPADVQVRVEYARAILDLDEDDRAGLAREQLDAAFSLPAETAFQKILRSEASEMLKGIPAK